MISAMILACLFWTVLFFFVNKYFQSSRKDLVVLTFGGVVSATLAIITIAIVSIRLPLQYEITPSSSIEIISMETQNDVTSHFILGTGSINQQLFYYVYEKCGGGYKLKRYNVENALILEDNNIIPQIRTFSVVNWQRLLLMTDDSNYVQIIIPLSSIIRQINPNPTR